jgi:Lon protease-like protein
MPLPLHVFEPRYRALARDAIDGALPIGMVLLAPGWEDDYHGRPAVHPVGTTGRIVSSTARPDGKFDLLLAGERRFRILGEEAGGAYRRARVAWLPEPEADPVEEGPLAAALLEAAEGIRPDIRAKADLLEGGLGPLVGFLAAACGEVAEARQAVLAAGGPAVRARALLSRLAPRAAAARALAKALTRGRECGFDRN